MLRMFFRYLRCFFILILLFSVGLICVSLIPNNALEPQHTKSITQIDREDSYANFLFSADGSILDNYTDKLMLLTCRISDAYDNPVSAAFDNNGYPRYWNGYLLTLKPILSQFTYQQIRYLNMFLLIISFCFCFSGIQQKINSAAAVGFAISIIACFLVFISESLQYFSDFFILFLCLILILYLPYFHKLSNSTLLLFSVGMTVNYFDLLTAPMITLGIPLIVVIALHLQENTSSFKNQIVTIVTHTASWCAGYFLTWAAKWTIGSLFLGKNVFADAFQTAQFRINGSETYPVDRKLMYRINFDTYFFAKGHKPALLFLIIFLILFYLFIRQHKPYWKNIVLPILFIGFYPYIWYFTFANHSQFHYFFTYRIQSITLFAIYAAVSCSIDWDKLRYSINRKQQKDF